MSLQRLHADRTTFGHLQERFEVRARALVYVRLTLMAVVLLVLAVPTWRRSWGVPLLPAAAGYLVLLVAHGASYFWIERRRARAVVFSTLCIDLVLLIAAIVISGGVKSSLMPTQLVFTMLFALLFPSPMAIVPPLLTLPIVALFDLGLGLQTIPADVVLLVWYAALNLIVVYIVVYLDGREQVALREVFRLQRERRQRELASQRTSIAREIHDGVGAALSGILLQAEYLAGHVAIGELKGELEELRSSAAEGMDELRRAVSILRREFHLSTAVPAYASAFGTRQRLVVETSVDGEEPTLAAEVELALFRTLQEALANVARHARAQRVDVSLQFGADAVGLSVTDDGCGFDPAQALPGHYGLRNMSERMRRIGGEVAVYSDHGGGARISVTIPRERCGRQSLDMYAEERGE